MFALEEYISEKEIIELFKGHMESTEKVYKKVGKEEVIPVLMVHLFNVRTRKIESEVVMLTDMTDKQKTLSDVGKMIQKKYSPPNRVKLPVCITFSSEAWSIKGDLKKETTEELTKRIKKAGGISKLKDKVESLIIACLTPDDRSALSVYEIEGKDRKLKMKLYKPTLDKEIENNMLSSFYQGYVSDYAKKKKASEETS